jgi:hypothetical protein
MGDAPRYYTDELDVLSAMHFIAEVWRFVNTHYNEELLCEVWLLN